MLSDVVQGIMEWLKDLAHPAPAANLVDHPDGKGAEIAVVKNGFTLTRLSGPETVRRTHDFHALRSFAEWLKKHAEPSHTEILVGDTYARAVLGDAAHASEVTCQLRPHPTFAAWGAAFARAFDPKALFAFIRAVESSFDPDAAAVLSGELQKLKAVRTEDLDMKLDPRGFYSVHGATDRVQVDASIPPAFTIRTPIYVGVPEPGGQEARERTYDLPILLTMDVSEKAISFLLSCPSLKSVLHDARLHAVQHLVDVLGDEFLVGLGDLKSEIVAG